MFASHTLNNGAKIPTVGLGTFQIRSSPGDDIIHKTIGIALKNGYRLIDTAAVYKNEADIGRALKDFLPKYNLSRKDVFITSKLSPKDHGSDRAEKACKMSIEALGCEYLDLYLIHWPGVEKLKSEDPENSWLRKGSWRALEKLYREGLVKSIGVSNYTIQHLDELSHYATIVPAVLQVEFHPQLFQEELLKYCREKGIWLQAYTSLGQGRLIEEAVVRWVAVLYDRSPAQVLLRWALQHGVGVIPKAVRSQHIQDNICLFDFELSKEDMASLNNMNVNTHFCWNPERVK